ncbi:MAG: hypothetical protein H6551_00675 [Chitinophagales bacterium]|nr:hypothetical protein [Chitinophagaceae bacterium]MCB9063636.1 hypothetical protein [Chitinophagales bacterium]
MQKSTILRRVAPMMLILALAVMMSASCTSTSKYGCPNKLEAGTSMP